MNHLIDIKRQALKYLSYREHSAEELRQKLTMKFGYIEPLNDILNELDEKGYQSDLRYAVMYIEYRSRKGYGKCYIQNALKQKGVSKNIIARSLDECRIDWQLVLCRLWEKKFSSAAPSNLTERCRQTRFLVSRGFDSGEINQLLGRARKSEVVFQSF